MQGVRNLRLGLVLRQRDGTSPFDIGPLCRLGLPGVSEGLVMGIPLTPDQMLADQDRALVRLERAARLCMEADPELGAVGLGSLCAVVAGRGEALARAFDHSVAQTQYWKQPKTCSPPARNLTGLFECRACVKVFGLNPLINGGITIGIPQIDG